MLSCHPTSDTTEDTRTPRRYFALSYLGLHKPELLTATSGDRSGMGTVSVRTASGFAASSRRSWAPGGDGAAMRDADFLGRCNRCRAAQHFVGGVDTSQGAGPTRRAARPRFCVLVAGARPSAAVGLSEVGARGGYAGDGGEGET